MLTYPDKQRFEQIRARWEAETCSELPIPMAGGKDKQHGPPPYNTSVEANTGGGRFRRKLSYGLSLISNPLSQRKTSTGRSPPESNPAKSASPRTHGLSEGLQRSQRAFSVIRGTGHLHQTGDSPSAKHTAQAFNDRRRENDCDTTPTPTLARSRTMSMIPRPRRSGSYSMAGGAQETSPSGHPTNSTATTTLHRESSLTPTKIPSPSPSQSIRRLVSPRQYLREPTVKESKFIGAGAAFAQPVDPSPSKFSVRSYTTPNLAKSVDRQQRSFMKPRKTVKQQQCHLPPNCQQAVNEDTPTRKSSSVVKLQMPGNQSRRLSSVPQPITTNRRSLGPGTAFDTSKLAFRTTPSAGIQHSSNTASTRTPLTAKRVPRDIQPSSLTQVNINRHPQGPATQPGISGPVVQPTIRQVNDTSVQTGLSTLR